MVYVGTDNKMNLRAVPDIALSSSNERGGYYFMNLSFSEGFCQNPGATPGVLLLINSKA